ncbi:MAG: hypothetical protein RIQ38_614 [Pseudomonadota bacterium]
MPDCSAPGPLCRVRHLNSIDQETIVTIAHHPHLIPLDEATGGVFSAETSGERSARLRDWLQSGPSAELMHEVYRELSARDKGAAKALREKLDELRRAKSQETLAQEWAQRAEQLLAQPRLYLADAMAWQRDAAKAGAPLSREPLAGLRIRLADWVKGVEDLQHQIMVLRESAVLLGQRIELLSTKSLDEALAAEEALQADVAQWLTQVQALEQDPHWHGVDLKFPVQIEASRTQLTAVRDGWQAALDISRAALADAQAPLPGVPVWADEIRQRRAGAAAVASAQAPAGAEAPATAREAKPRPDAAARQALRDLATNAVLKELEALEKEVQEGHGKATVGAANSLRQVLKLHGRFLDPALDARVHAALTNAGELEGWQRWRADQLRQELLQKAQGLLGAEGQPTLPGRKMQEALRELRDAWKQTDSGGLPNHALWKKFDAACNEAYKVVQAWLDQVRQEGAAHRAQRQALLAEFKAWAEAQAGQTNWREQQRALHQFSDRWRHAGHMAEKAFVEMQNQWKQLVKQAAAPLEAAQKASMARRHALIERAREVGAAPLRVDAIRALQQEWQLEAQSVPLDRKTEQKLWEQFRAPLDEAFKRKDQARTQAQEALSAVDRAVIDAARALQDANASGDAARIRSAMAALAAARQGQADAHAAAAAAAPAPTAEAAAPAADSAEPAADAAPASPEADSAPAPEAAPAPKPVRPVVAVRGDDRPGQRRTEAAPAARPGRRDDRRDGRDARGGPRDSREGWRDARGPRDEAREPRGPRLSDAAFRAQRDALEQAEQSLRKLAMQAHGEALTGLLQAWQTRQADTLPSTQDLGRAVSSAVRQSWAGALAQAPQASAAEPLLRLEMAAEVPTPAEHLNERRALQLQLLTRRNDPSPAQTWSQDVARVLAMPHDPATARRLQNALKVLLRR